MKTEVQTRSFNPTEILRESVKHRLKLALTRFQEQVERVRVHFLRITDPRAGRDRDCHLQVHVHGLPRVVGKKRQPDFRAAINGASQRAGRSQARWPVGLAHQDVRTHL